VRKLHLIALAGVIACASSGTGGSSSPGADRNLISQSELQLAVGNNLYEVVEKLRPNFLRSRGATSINTAGDEYPVVYVDGRRYGDIGSLRSLIPSQVSQVRYYDASSAGARFGVINAPGVIEVIIKQ
jgi:hypothetical protein